MLIMPMFSTSYKVYVAKSKHNFTKVYHKHLLIDIYIYSIIHLLICWYVLEVVDAQEKDLMISIIAQSVKEWRGWKWKPIKSSFTLTNGKRSSKMSL